MIKLFYIIQGFSNWLFYFISPFYKKKMEKLFTKRLSICDQCSKLNKKTRQCTFCGCFVDAKTKCIYRLDKDNKAFYLNNEEKIYACELKKW